MQRFIIGASLSALALAAAPTLAQDAKPASPKAPAALTMTGCVSPKPGAAGQYTFQEAEGIGEYRLNGKDIKKFAGQKVELVVGTPSKGLAVKGGLWPSPNVAARGGGVDAAQESIARQPGGGGAGVGSELPELRVSRLRAVEGACQ